MTEKEALKILALDFSATEEMIKKAYRKMAQKYHPDNKETQDEKRFIQVREAYEFLMNRTGINRNSNRKESTEQKPCPQCKGTGKRKWKRKTQRGIVVVAVPCEACKGTGCILG